MIGRNFQDKCLEINELVLLAEQAGRCRLSSAARRRVLAAVPQQRVPWTAAFAPAVVLSAAAVMILAVLPALLGPGAGILDSASGPEAALAISVSQAQDGSIILRWDNGQTVHTVRRATVAADIGKMSGTKVQGGVFLDSLAARADVVFYQVD